MAPGTSSVDTSVLKKAREQCWQVGLSRVPGCAPPGAWLPAVAWRLRDRPPSRPARPCSPPLQARDAFYACVEAAGVTYTVDAPIPAQCSATRAAYTSACKASWVKHFDLLQVCVGFWELLATCCVLRLLSGS